MSAQASAALEVANERRLACAAAKRAVAVGERSIADVLADPLCDGMRVGQLVRAVHRIGDQKADKILAKVPVGARRRLRDLTDRQRDVLADIVDSGSPW